MNIASAQTTPIASPPSLGALAPFTASGTKGQTAQGTVLLEAFLSLLTSLAPQVAGDEDFGDDTSGTGGNKKDDRKESAQGVLAPLQVPQPGVSLPLTLAVPVVTTTGEPSPVPPPAQDANAVAGSASCSAPCGSALEAPGNVSVSHMTTSPLPPVFETGNSGGSTIALAALQSVSIAPTISSPRWQTSNAFSNTPMAFAVLLKEASGQSSNVPERSTDAGVAIRSQVTVDCGSTNDGATVQKVLQNLLRERVSIRDAVSILEALGEAAAITKNTTLLTEYVRQSIRRQVAKPYLNDSGDLTGYFLDPAIEQEIENAVEHAETASHLNLGPNRVRSVIDRLSKCGSDSAMVLLTSSGSRFFVRQIAEGSMPNLNVLSHAEIPAGVRVVSLGVVN